MLQHKKGNIYIGTSGWNYKHWVGKFYPGGIKNREQLDYYLTKFRTVEVNSSFYHLPAATTCAYWREKSPVDFLFSVKANRYFTHLMKLKVERDMLQDFLKRITPLAEKMGPILFQLPPRWHCNPDRLESFLETVPKGYRLVFEFRDITWYDSEVYTLLSKYNCAFCIYELDGHRSPEMLTADFTYIRLHGPGRKYEGSYSHEILQDWARKCLQWQETGKDVYLYFDNDQHAYAAFNALELSRLTDVAT